MEQAEEQAQEIDSSKIHYSQFTYSFPPKKIACGIHHSVCISNLNSSSSFVADQSTVVLGWGRNVYNVVGLGEDHRVSLIPVKIDCPDFEKGGGIYEVSCGHSHSLFLRKNRHGPGGEVLGSGLGNRGRQGYPNPHADADDTPEVEDIWFVEGPKPIPISNVPIARIVCGADHSLALDLNGVLWAWGMNADGQCGVGHQRDVLAPEATVMPKMKGAKVLVAHMAAGSRHSMLVTAKDGSMGSTAGGKVFVWGANSDGRLGLGHDRNEPLPVPVEALLNHKMVLVSAGEAHSGAVDTNGNLYMWGLGSYGRLGLGEVMDVPLARRVPLPDDPRVSQVALGSFHSVVLAGSRTQSVYTWGYGEALGNKVGGGISLSPLVVSLEDTKAQVLQIAAGPYHTLVLMEDGELITFGQGASGRLGTGHSKNHKLPVSLGAHGFATKLKQSTDGEKAATQKRSLEHPSEKSLKRSAAASSQPGGKQSWEIAKVDCGEMFTCAVTWHGALYTWGSGARGQLGTGSLQDSWVPKVVRMPSGRLVKSMACGREHCIAVTYDGNAYAWGRGDKGQLGVGRNEDTATPKVVEIHNVVSVVAGEDHSGAICRGEDENELWMWGSSELGKLGLGEATSSDSIPVAIRAFAKSTEPYKVPMAVSCGQYHTAVICVRDQDSDDDRISGRVWTFGGGWFGRLGHNDMENQYEPKIISSLITKIRTVHCGAYHTCGLSYEKGIYNDNGELAGDLWVWGRNRCIGEHEHAKVPMKFMQIDGQPKVTCVVTSEMTTMLVTLAGLVYAWGDNRNGQIGLEGGKKESPQPEIIRNLPQPPILMGAGPAHMVVYARNKAMFAWGNQSCGRLGLQEKKMEKVIYKPRLVRAEWGSIEAMSGADDEETAGGDAQKKVTAAALATIGEGRPATEDGGSDVEGSLSDVEDEDSGEEDKTKENMLHAITSGQKVQRFSTMQMMLKEEPESNKISSLHKHEKELKKLVESCAHSLAIVTEKERRLSILEDRVQKGIVHLNEILHGPVPKTSEDDRLDQEIKSKVSTYEELFTVLQLQVSYLATLSMTIKDEVSAEVFVNVVSAIFADLQDSRIRNLFILLLHLMTTKELESAKNIDDVFQPSSRVFRLFSFFALHRFNYEVVVHPVMDCHKMDEQGQPVTLMGAVTYKTLEKAQTWALDFNRYLESPSIAAKLKEQASQELRADFQKELDAFVDFFKVDVVAAISRFALPRSFWSFFAFCRESIRECNLVGVEDEAGTEVELKIVEPIFRLFVNGIILPLLRAPKKFGGREVGLPYCEKNNFDGDVLFNTCTVLDAFQSMTETAGNKESHAARLSKIALRLRPELLCYLLDRTITADVVGDDPDTTVTVQSFLCHFDRSSRSIYVPPSQLLLFQNLVLFNVNKIRLQSGDRLEEACRKIGRWPEQLVKEATEKAEKNAEVLYRFTLQHRFLFTEGSLAICPASKCTVPLCLSAAAGSDALRRHGDEVNLVQNVDVVRTLKEDNPNKVLEDLFRMLPPLKSSNFVDLKEELEALWSQCAAGQNEALTEKLAEGVQAVADYIETELSPEEVLDAMASVILSRNRHSRYLHSMSVGLSRLPMEESRHAKEVRSAEQELKAVIEHSKQMLLPERITEVAKLEAAILKGSDLNFLIKKQAARVKTKATKKVTRHNLSDLLSDGKVLECYSELDTVQGKVYLTMWSIDADIIVHVGLLEEGDAMLEFVKQFRIPGDVVKQLPFADREDTTGLPLEGPVIMKWRSLELSKVLKEVPPAD